MKVLNIVKNFDYLVYDASSSRYSVQDLVKLAESSNISKVVIKKWNKKFIDYHFSSLKMLSNKISVVFDYLGYSPNDMLLVKNLFEKKENTSPMEFSFGECSFAPWIRKVNSNNYEWTFSYNDNFMISNLKKYNSMIEKSSKYVLTFSNNKYGMYGSSLDSLRKIPSEEIMFLLKMNDTIRAKNKKSMIYVICLNNFDEINKIKKNDIDKILSMGFSSLAILDKSSVSKYELSWDEYAGTIDLSKYLDLFIFGLPFDFYGNESPDLSKFKWIIDNEEFKKNIINIKSKNNNRVFVVS